MAVNELEMNYTTRKVKWQRIKIFIAKVLRSMLVLIFSKANKLAYCWVLIVQIIRTKLRINLSESDFAYFQFRSNFVFRITIKLTFKLVSPTSVVSRRFHFQMCLFILRNNRKTLVSKQKQAKFMHKLSKFIEATKLRIFPESQKHK
jgi:hypothetical protein